MSDLDLAIKAATEAGQIIQEGFLKTHNISKKPDKGFVTEIDTASEKKILEILGSSHAILAEETKSTIPNEETYWAIDPLDGTTNFIRGLPYFAVSIALMKSNIPVIGVVYNPIPDELFSAELHLGSLLNGTRIHTADKNNLIFVNSGYNLEHKIKYAENGKNLIPHYNLRKLGSTAYELASMARGVVDGFIAWGDELWDHAAGILLVREAGGIVTDWEGNEWTSDTNYVLAANKTIHPQLLKTISSYSN